MASTFVGKVRSDGSARMTSFSSCCWSMSDFWSASSGNSAVAACAMLNDGSMVRSVPSSVSSARDSTVIAPGTSRPWRCITSSIKLMACGSKLPEPRPSVSTKPMSASRARLSPPSSPPARCMVALASTTGSLSWKPIAISCSDSSTNGLRRPTAPKSRNQVGPWGRRRCSPGAGRRGTDRRAAPDPGTTATADSPARSAVWARLQLRRGRRR